VQKKVSKEEILLRKGKSSDVNLIRSGSCTVKWLGNQVDAHEQSPAHMGYYSPAALKKECVISKV
jgi:hypothetical protein